MGETPSERHARERLQAKGFDVERIPRGKTRTADFRVSDGRSTYLVEVTGRKEDKLMARLRADARAKGVADCTRGLRYSKALDEKIRDKAEQLELTPVQADFSVLWIAAFHRDWQFVWALLKRTLLGFTKLGAFRTGHELPQILPCFYYHPFLFHQLPMLDAVVFSTEESGCMFVNALSTRAADFRSSKFYGLLERDARLDPSEFPRRLPVVDPAVDRSRPNAQWEYLKQHYGLMTSEVVEVDWQGIASLSVEEGLGAP